MSLKATCFYYPDPRMTLGILVTKQREYEHHRPGKVPVANQRAVPECSATKPGQIAVRAAVTHGPNVTICCLLSQHTHTQTLEESGET